MSVSSSPGRSSSSVARTLPQRCTPWAAVNAVVPHQSLETVALEWAAEINSKSPTAQRMVKYALNLIDDGLVEVSKSSQAKPPAWPTWDRRRGGGRAGRIPGEAKAGLVEVPLASTDGAQLAGGAGWGARAQLMLSPPSPVTGWAGTSSTRPSGATSTRLRVRQTLWRATSEWRNRARRASLEGLVSASGRGGSSPPSDTPADQDFYGDWSPGTRLRTRAVHLRVITGFCQVSPGNRTVRPGAPQCGSSRGAAGSGGVKSA